MRQRVMPFPTPTAEHRENLIEHKGTLSYYVHSARVHLRTQRLVLRLQRLLLRLQRRHACLQRLLLRLLPRHAALALDERAVRLVRCLPAEQPRPRAAKRARRAHDRPRRAAALVLGALAACRLRAAVRAPKCKLRVTYNLRVTYV